MAEEKRKGKWKKSHKWVLFVVIGVAALFLALIGSAFLVYDHYYKKTNYVPDPESIEISSDILESVIASTELDPSEESSILADLESIKEERAALESIRKEMDSMTDDRPEAISRSDVYNLLLIGVDRRNATWNGNSDTMVVCSINYTKKTITLTSLMRDTAANIPGIGVRKLNHAFAVGNAPLLVSTVANNFGIVVDNYAWTDFTSMEQIIEILGGIDLYLSVKEAKTVGITIESPMVVHLDGKQAVLHARDRSSGGSDYLRTQRQRNVLLAILNKAKSGSLGDLNRVANEVLPFITHNISQGKMLSLITDMLSISEYTLQEQRIPYDGLYYSSNELLVPNYAETAARWKAFVY